MSKINIDINAVNSAELCLKNAKNITADVSSSVKTIRKSVDGAIKARNSIDSRFVLISNELSDVEDLISDINRTVNAGIRKYSDADNWIERKAENIRRKSLNRRDSLSQLFDDITGGAILGNYDPVVKLREQLEDFIEFINNEGENGASIGKDKLRKLIDNFFDYYQNNTGAEIRGEQVKRGYPEASCFDENYSVGKAQQNSNNDIVSGILGLIDKYAGIETELYNYFEGSLPPKDGAAFNGKFGTAMGVLGFIGNVSGTIKDGIELCHILTDPDSNAYNKVGAGVDFLGTGTKLGVSGYVLTQAKTKGIYRHIINPKGTKNQILAEIDYKYGYSQSNAKKMGKIATAAAITDVACSFVGEGISAWGNLTADGEFSGKDAGELGMRSSMAGFSSVVSNLTFGLVNIDDKKACDNILGKADRFMNGDSWAAEYIRNEDNNIVARFGVSVGAGAEMLLGELGEGIIDTYETISDGCETLGGWISSGWNEIKSWF